MRTPKNSEIMTPTADPLDLVGRVVVRLPGVYQVRQPRADRVGQDDAHARAARTEEPSHAGDRAPRADAADEGADAAAALGQHLRPSRRFMDARVGRVIKLLRQEPAALADQAAGDVLEVVGRGRGSVGHDYHLGPQGGQRRALVG
jgi:hypothetical protein